MALIYDSKTSSGTHVYLWNITEDEKFFLERLLLPEKELKLLNTYRNSLRRLQGLTIRMLLKNVIPDFKFLTYTESGKPIIPDSKVNLSITHSGSIVGIAISSVSSPGIDIELVNPKIHKIAERFVNPSEWDFIKEPDCTEKLYILWCAKETLFKMYANGNLSFKNNLIIQPFHYADIGILTGEIITDRVTSAYKMHFKRIEGYMLVYSE